MAFLKYKCEFYSQNSYPEETYDSKWRLYLYKKGTQGAQPANVDFNTTKDGFILNMSGSDDGMLAPIKTTSVSFNFIIEEGNSDQAQILDDLLSSASSNEESLCVEIWRKGTAAGLWFRYWIGVVLGDLSAGKDTSPNRIVNIKAVDGLAQLKYKKWDFDNYGGMRSALGIIKTCLKQISTASAEFGFWPLSDTSVANKDYFLAHTPYYYCEAMGSLDGTWKNNVNHDPLALVKINTIIFKNSNGQGWSYYQVLEQILAAFQLRLMMCSHRNDTNGSTLEEGAALWYLQAPLVFHNNDNDSGYDNDQIIFYHKNDLSSDTAIEVDVNFVCDDSNPEQALAGAVDNFIPPLLSYQSIYKHSVFQPIAVGPLSFNSVNPMWDSVYPNYNYFESAYFSGDSAIDLTGNSDIGLTGWTGSNYGFHSEQKIVIIGNVSIQPIDVAGYNGDNGYISAQEFWENNYDPNSGPYSYEAYDFSKVMPRMGLSIDVVGENLSGGAITKTFNLGSMRWGNLYGSLPWTNASDFLSYQTDQDPSNMKGWDGTSDGIRFDLAEFNTGNLSSVPLDEDDAIAWGQDVGPNGDVEGTAIQDWMYWMEMSYDGYNEQTAINYNHFTWFSPEYFDAISQVQIYDWGGPITWPDNGSNWGTGCNNGAFTFSTPFMITSPFIPWIRGDGSVAFPAELDDFGWSRLLRVKFIYGVPRDKVFDSSGNGYYVCPKSWDMNRQLLCRDRGVHYSYEYTDVRVFIMGATAGANSYDTSYGWYENGNGTPSEELVQEPEIVIGDEPAFDPFAGTDSGIAGGEYMGMFKIFTTANATGGPEEGDTINDWRTEAMETSGGEDMQLHHIRAKMAIAHYYMLKRKLNLRFLDRSPDRTIERCPFSQLYYWTSGDWATNQVGTDIAFIPTGGKFVAGTGELTITLEDCITYSKDNLIQKNYSSNG
tara:strand:+ start:224 stop:3028 length:2805 start_codon:yes stop_codon:yes gene_type:complete